MEASGVRRPSSSVAVRVGGIDDLDDLTRLFRANLETHAERSGDVVKPNYDWRKETRLRVERDTSRFLVAHLDGQPAGMVVLQNSRWQKKSLFHRIRRRFVSVPTGAFKSPRTASVTDLFVYPEYRRKGVASALVTAAIDHFREAGIERVYADVGVWNEPSISVFESCGFEIVQSRLTQTI